MLKFNGMRSTLLKVVFLLLFLKPPGNYAQTELISLDVDPNGVSSGSALCPNTNIYFHCIARDVAFLIWERNDQQIQDYTSRDNASLQPETINGFTLYLNSSTPVVGGRRNLTSTLVGRAGSNLLSGDRIECVDNTGQLITLNFTQISAPPAPTGFRNTVTNPSNSLYFGFVWDASFNTANNVGAYRLMPNDSSVQCPQNGCSSSTSDPCQCSGLTAGIDVSISVSAVSCGSLEGPVIVVNIAPRVPEETVVCSAVRVYSYSGNLTTIQVIWNKIQDPANITLELRQAVENYSVSVNGDDTNISTFRVCPDMSTECSFFHRVQTSATDFTISVTAFNVVGGGPVSMCPLPNVTISQVFSLTLATTDPTNRTVICTQLYQGIGIFRCEFCLSSSNTCYDLRDNTLANAALGELEDGRYMYQATAYIDGVPVASISDNFSTSCQLDELGGMDVNQTSPLCDLNGGSIENGFVCYNGTVAGSLATYMCNVGYTLTGTDERLCRLDGVWTGETPLCTSVNDVGSPYSQKLRTSLLVLTIIFCTISAALSVISLVLILKPVQQPCSRLSCKESIWQWCIFFLEILFVLVSVILLCAYSSDPNGLSQGNTLIAAFVFSVLLIICSVSWAIATVVLSLRKKKTEDFDPPDNHRGDQG